MPSFLGSEAVAAGHGIYETPLVPAHRPGSLMTTGDGRYFRYAKVGAVALVAGNAIQAPAIIGTTHVDLTPSAAAIGATTVSVTLGATLASINQYANGYLVCSTGPSNGIAYRIKSHPAADASAAVVLTLDDPLQVAISTSSRIDLVADQYTGVIQSPVTTLTGVIVGGAVIAAPISSYTWLQVRGIFAGLMVGTPIVGGSLSCPTSAAGGFAVNSGVLPIVARATSVGVDGKNKGIDLLIS